MALKAVSVLGARPAAARHAEHDAARAAVKASRRWYKLKRWLIRRADQLRAYPLCAMCAKVGIVKAANVADHVQPHREDEGLFWHGELQSLCAGCHSRHKQRIEARK